MNDEGVNTAGCGCPGGAQPQRTFDFSEALKYLKDGVAVARMGWHLQEMYIRLQRPDNCSKMTLPYVYLTLPPADHRERTFDIKSRVPWLASQTDILSDDWFIVSPK